MDAILYQNLILFNWKNDAEFAEFLPEVKTELKTQQGCLEMSWVLPMIADEVLEAFIGDKEYGSLCRKDWGIFIDFFLKNPKC